MTETTELKEDLDHNTIDAKYLAEKRIWFLGIINNITEEDTKAKIVEGGKYSDDLLYGNAKGMSKEDFVQFLTRYELEVLVNYLKHGLRNTYIDTTLEEIEEDKLLNLLGHLGVVTHYDEKLKLWLANRPLKDGLIIYHGKNRTIVGLRSLISKISGNYVSTAGWTNPFIRYWMEVNSVQENPLTVTEDDLKAMLADCGTSLEEIEEDFKQKEKEFYDNPEEMEKQIYDDKKIVIEQ